MNQATKRALEDLTVLSGGFIVLAIVQLVNSMIDPFIALLGFVASICLICVGTCALTIGVFEAKPLLIFKQFFSRFHRNQKAVAWIWATAFAALVFSPLVYWALGWPYQIVYDTVVATTTFTGTMATALTAVRLLISYLLSFVLFAIVIWSWVQAKTQNYGGR